MNNVKWTLGAVGYMCVWAYAIALIVYNVIGLFFGTAFSFWTVAGLVVLAVLVYLIVRKNPYDDQHLKMAKKVGA